MMTSTCVIMTYPKINNDKQKDKEDEDSKNVQDIAKKVAKIELREDQITKEQMLTQFKQWLKQNRDVENCRTDDSFLLRFLRVKKFSLPMAQQMLLKYLNLRKTFMHMSIKLDFLDSRMMELINDGYMFTSPIRDSNGRRVVIAIAKNFNPQRFTCDDMARIHMITYETLLDDESTQILGFTHIGDVSQAPTSLITLWSPTEFATLLKWGEQSYPMRHKEIHILNLPSAVRYVFDFALSRFSQKMKDRIILHSELNDLHKRVDPQVLPKEYGGKIPMSEMLEAWKKELATKREKLLALDEMKLLSDRGIIRRRSPHAAQNGVLDLPGSFRKLELD